METTRKEAESALDEVPGPEERVGEPEATARHTEKELRTQSSHPPSFVEVGLTIAGALLAVVLLLYLLPPPG